MSFSHWGNCHNMERIKRNIPFIELIAKPVSRQQAIALLKTSSEDQINAISELALNILQGRLDLTKHYKSLLVKEAGIIRKLSNKENGPKTRKAAAIRNLTTVSTLLAVCLNQLKWLKNSY